MDPTLTAPLAILLLIPIGVLLADGAGLASGVGWLHRLGLPIGSGPIDLLDVLPPDSALPSEAHGANGVWLDEDTVGYWSGRVRIGFRDSFGIQALRGMGIACSGILYIAPDRRSAVFTERLRLAPLLLVGCVSTAGMALWAYAEAPVAVLPLIPLMFLGLYCFFAFISVRHMRSVRASFG
ncbi:MAG: hypothetical protein ACI8RZ_001101 [Myxococcota bacterium]|jgi:hypothetical protein